MTRQRHNPLAHTRTVNLCRWTAAAAGSRATPPREATAKLLSQSVAPSDGVGSPQGTRARKLLAETWQLTEGFSEFARCHHSSAGLMSCCSPLAGGEWVKVSGGLLARPAQKVRMGAGISKTARMTRDPPPCTRLAASSVPLAVPCRRQPAWANGGLPFPELVPAARACKARISSHLVRHSDPGRAAHWLLLARLLAGSWPWLWPWLWPWPWRGLLAPMSTLAPEQNRRECQRRSQGRKPPGTNLRCPACDWPSP